MFNDPLIVAKAQKTHGGNDPVMQLNVKIPKQFNLNYIIFFNKYIINRR